MVKNFPKGTKVEILVAGEWQGPYGVTAFEGRTSDHIVLSGPSGFFEHYYDGAFNTRIVA